MRTIKCFRSGSCGPIRKAFKSAKEPLLVIDGQTTKDFWKRFTGRRTAEAVHVVGDMLLYSSCIKERNRLLCIGKLASCSISTCVSPSCNLTEICDIDITYLSAIVNHHTCLLKCFIARFRWGVYAPSPLGHVVSDSTTLIFSERTIV